MKNNLFIVAALSFASLGFNSCSSSDDTNTPIIDGVENVLNLPYSKLSVADQKVKLVGDAEAVLKQVEGLSNEKAIKLIISLEDKLEELFDEMNKNSEEKRILDRSIDDLLSYHGSYTWLIAEGKWKENTIGDKDKLTLNFPAIKSGTTNNGQVEIQTVMSNVVISDTQIPSKVNIKMSVDKEIVGTVFAEAKGLNAETILRTATVDTKIGSYLLDIDVDKQGVDNQVNIALLNGKTKIMSAYVDLVAHITSQMLEDSNYGSFADANVIANIGQKLVLAGYFDSRSYFTGEKVLKADYHKAMATTGTMNWAERKNVEAAAAKIKEEGKVELMNKYSNIALGDIADKYKIAKVTFRLNVEEYSYVANVWDYDHLKWIEVPITYYTLDQEMVLNFNDNTPLGAEVFFGTGFNSIIHKINELIGKTN